MLILVFDGLLSLFAVLRLADADVEAAFAVVSLVVGSMSPLEMNSGMPSFYVLCRGSFVSLKRCC